MKKKMNAAERRAQSKQKQKQRIAQSQADKAARQKSDKAQGPRKEQAPLILKTITRKKEARQLKSIDFSAPFVLRAEVLSPLALGSGLADVNVDSDIVRDEYGQPYFPAKRLKGLLYESGLEVAEMAELSGISLFTRGELDSLFRHGRSGGWQIVITDLVLENSERMAEEWDYLFRRYPAIFQSDDVLDTYAQLRYQTKIDDKTGTAADSLRNLQVLAAPEAKPLSFNGNLRLIPSEGATMKRERAMSILALATRNLSQAGLKRTRGFGRIGVTIEQDSRDVLIPLVEAMLKTARDGMGGSVR